MTRARFPVYRQMDQMDCGPTCLRMIARHHGRLLDAETMRSKCQITREGVSFAGIAEAAESIGLSSLAVEVTYDMLRQEAPLPCIAHWRQRHFIVVRAVRGDKVDVVDPAFGAITYGRGEFLCGWQHGPQHKAGRGLLLLLEPTPEFHQQEDAPECRRGMGFLLSYLRPHRRLIAQLGIGLLIGTLLQLVFPFLTQALVDQGINHHDLSFVHLILLGQLILFLSQTVVDVLRSWLLLHIGSRTNVAILSHFLIKLMRLPVAFFDGKTTGDLMQRVQDHTRIEALLSSSVLNVAFSAVNLVVFGVVLGLYDLRVFGLFALGSALHVAWVWSFMRRRAALEYKRFDQAAGNQSSMIQLIQGMTEIKLNNSERRRRWEWEAIQVRLFRIAVRSLALVQWQGLGANFINELKNILITFISARSVIAGDMSLGMMLAVQYIIGQMNAPIASFITLAQAMQDARLSLDRLAEIHARDDEEDRSADKLSLPAQGPLLGPLLGPSLEPSAGQALHLSGVEFRYGGARSPLVLRGVDFTIPAGKTTAIVGASGSGKTTLLKLLLRIYSPTEGALRVGGANLESVDVRSWRARCGAVMQNGYIFADTIARNISESSTDGVIDRDRLLLATRVANLEELIDSLPLGYNTRLGSAGISLSGGQSQRILIARAVYKNPDFLFFDEATSALDATNERVIMEQLAAFNRGRTVLVIAHRLSTVRDADQIIVMDQGMVVEQGRHETLAQARGPYFDLVRNQLELGAA